MEGAFQPGAVLLGKYRVESVLGRGGMGVVLRVTHLHLGEELAIKILLPDAAAGPDVHARFLREAQSAVRLRGEHVTRVSDVGMLPEGAPYIVMEYLRGLDLAGELRRRGVLSPGEAVDYVLQACEALAEAHALGIVHRDIKPSNLFLTYRPDGTPLVKVLDFGISKAPVSGGSLTRTDMVMGTPGYMSPEQMKAARDVDARTDIWSLGIVLYELLSGHLPFQGEAFSAVVFKVATEPPPPMDPRLPRGLPEVLLRCLVKDRAGRFASVADLAAALGPFARDQRSASLVADRTRRMLEGGGAGMQPDTGSRDVRLSTTLSGSARMITSRPSHRRYALAGSASLLASAALVVVVSWVMPSGSPGSRGSDQSLDVSQIVTITPAPEDAAASTVEHSPVTADKGRQKAAHCQELEAQRDWQGLQDCSSELAVLGIKDKTARTEQKRFSSRRRRRRLMRSPLTRSRERSRGEISERRRIS